MNHARKHLTNSLETEYSKYLETGTHLSRPGL